jgi:hypothetical protein
MLARGGGGYLYLSRSRPSIFRGRGTLVENRPNIQSISPGCVSNQD